MVLIFWRMIVDQQLSSGERLPSEKKLIERYHSDRGTIRENLKLLETLGLIERTPGPNGCTRIRAVDSREAMQSLANYLQ